jgi:hypothetical protein
VGVRGLVILAGVGDWRRLAAAERSKKGSISNSGSRSGRSRCAVGDSISGGRGKEGRELREGKGECHLGEWEGVGVRMPRRWEILKDLEHKKEVSGGERK